MNDRDLPKPPPRRLPPEVRDRVRARVLASLDDAPRNRFLNSRGPLAVAAGVAVLAAGAMIVTQSVGDGSSAVPPGRTTATAPVPFGDDSLQPNADGELDRCLGALRFAGMERNFPERALWQPVASRQLGLVKVTAAMIGNKPLFCQTTETSVTITNPAAPPAFAEGTMTGVLLESDEGVVAGVADPSWAGVDVEVTRGGVGMRGVSEILPHGLFVHFGQLRPTEGAQVQVGPPVQDKSDPLVKIDVPRPTPPAIRYLRDLPTNPPPDRDSERGKWAAECLDKSNNAVPDPDSWRPGAWASVDGSRVIQLRFGSYVGFCLFEPTGGAATAGRYVFGPSVATVPGDVSDPQSLLTPSVINTTSGPRMLFSGLAPPTAATVRLVLDDNTTIDADLWDSSFVAVLPKDRTPALLRIVDAAGNTIYDKPVGR